MLIRHYGEVYQADGVVFVSLPCLSKGAPHARRKDCIPGTHQQISGKISVTESEEKEEGPNTATNFQWFQLLSSTLDTYRLGNARERTGILAGLELTDVRLR